MDEKRLEPYLTKVRNEGRFPSEPGRLAGYLIRDGILTNFQAEQLLQGKWRRFTIGKYKVLERLGQGGMGSVYLCEHKLMRRRVAVKVLPTARAAEESSLERFYREARAVAALDHPNIVHAYDIDQDETLHFLVMEYVDGASLQDIVKKSGPLDPVRAAHYIYQSAQGLSHAHLAGLVHRDIKPGNLLVDRLGVVKILDMGLARFFTDEEDMLTKKYDETVLGTADYLAPEQAVDSHEADTRADIYSLGGTFYFLLTGSTPFGEGTVAQKLIWHQNRQPKSVTTFRRDVPPEMVAILNKMMAKNPADRYQLPLEVAEALAPWVQQPIAPPSESEMPRLSPAAIGGSWGDTMAGAAAAKIAAAPSSSKSWKVTAPASPAPQIKAGPGAPPVPSATPAPALPQAAAKMQAAAPAAKSANTNAGPFLPTQAARAAAPVNAAEFPWDSLAGANAAGDFGTRPTSLHPPSSRRSKKAGGSQRLWLGLGIAAGLALIIAAGAAFVLWKFVFTAAAQPEGPKARLPLRVSRDGRPGSYGSIQAAVRAAVNGDVLELWDERYEENVVIDDSRGSTRIVIRPAPGKLVAWSSRIGQGESPLLLLNKAKELRVEGAGRLLLDGQGRSKSLMQISFHSPGLTLDGVQLRGYTGNAVHLINCSGTSGQPVVLRNLQFTDPQPPSAKAIWFDARPKVYPQQNEHIQIRDCQFPRSPDQAVGWARGEVLGKNIQLPPGITPP